MQGKTKNNVWKASSCLGTKPQDFKGPRLQKDIEIEVSTNLMAW